MDVVDRLAAVIGRLACALPRAALAVDGPDAAGKTVLADRLAAAAPVATLRACGDDWLNPQEQRYRQGELSAQGYYRDAFDHRGLAAELLLPFRAGSAYVRPVRGGERVEIPPRVVLLVDGVFLLRPPLGRLWDLSVYLRIAPAESSRRGVARDRLRFGSTEAARLRYERRYLPAQRIYAAEVDPQSLADIVIDNSDTARPRLLRAPGLQDPDAG